MKRILLLLLLPLLIFGQEISVRVLPAVCSIQVSIYERVNHDKSWIGWCWKNEFTKVSDLSDYYSPAGVPIKKFTKQTPAGFENWIWDDFGEYWGGTDFDLRRGHGLEVIATKDTVLLLQGSYLPNSIVELDNGMNWVSIPDNTIYGAISDIADDISPDGSAVVGFSHTRPDGLWESWIYIGAPFFWIGTDFTLVPGEAVEFNCNKDTVWNPIEENVTSIESKPAVCSMQVSINENPGATPNKNWIGWCWKNEFSKISELQEYYSPDGEPIVKFTEQTTAGYRSWIYDDDFGWYGTDFDLRLGHGLSAVATIDTVLLFQGSYLPNSVIELDDGNNWVSIPDNTIYTTINDIAEDISPTGSAVEKFTRLLDDQTYINWIWNPVFLVWYGDDWTLEAGEAIQFECTKDTVWNPIEENATSIESKPYDCSIQYPLVVNEGATDKNWVGLCWDNTFTKVTDLVAYYCPYGVPINHFTRLNNGLYESYTYSLIPVPHWVGPDFDLRLGHGVEVSATAEVFLWLQGAYFPDSVIELDEGINFVSIPSNTIYSTVSDITDDLSPDGIPVSKLVMLDDTLQAYYSWIYHSVLGWYGNHPTTPNFPIVPGEAIQFDCTKDTVWNPIEE